MSAPVSKNVKVFTRLPAPLSNWHPHLCSQTSTNHHAAQLPAFISLIHIYAGMIRVIWQSESPKVALKSLFVCRFTSDSLGFFYLFFIFLPLTAFQPTPFGRAACEYGFKFF